VLIAVSVALFATWAGIFIAFYEVEPTSFFIVTIVFAIYVVVRGRAALADRKLRRSPSTPSTPEPA
jgi:ABC-type Mn2+/Zn2+ transport system permease subunit